MQKRRRIQQTETLENRLRQAAVRLRQQAGGTPPGIEREYLISEPAKLSPLLI